MEYKNPIDEKFDEVSEKFDKATNVISTSKTVFQFLNIIWYLVLILAIVYAIGGLHVHFNKNREEGVFMAAIGGGVAIVGIILIRNTTKRIKSINSPK